MENATRYPYKISDESSLCKFSFLMYILGIPHHAVLNQSSLLASSAGKDDRRLPSPDPVCGSATSAEMSWLGMVVGCRNAGVRAQKTLLPLKGGMNVISKRSWFYHVGPDPDVTGAVVSESLASLKHLLGVVTSITQTLQYWVVLVAASPMVLYVLLFFYELNSGRPR